MGGDKYDVVVKLIIISLCSPRTSAATLWCTVGSTCHSKLDGAVDGTSCGEDKVSLPVHERERTEAWAL